MKFKTLYFNPLNIIILSFGIFFFIGFFFPTFLLNNRMNFFENIPSANPIGSDIKTVLGMTEINNFYPYSPFATVVFSLLNLFNKNFVFYLITFLTLISIFSILYVFFRTDLIKNKITFTILILVFIFSYGFQFEIERGQWNLIAINLSFLGIWLYNNNKKIFGIILITFSIHLKIFPLIFFFMIFNRNVKIKTLIYDSFIFIFLNISLLFIFGFNAFKLYINQLYTYSLSPYSWVGNHSLVSFGSINNLIDKNYIYLFVFTSIFAFIFASSFVMFYFKKQKVFISQFFIITAVGAIIIPSVSHDYTLTILSLTLIPFLCNLTEKLNIYNSIYIFIICSIYFIISYSYSNYLWVFKPIFENKFPVLFLLLITVWIKQLLEFIFYCKNIESEYISKYKSKLLNFTLKLYYSK